MITHMAFLDRGRIVRVTLPPQHKFNLTSKLEADIIEA